MAISYNKTTWVNEVTPLDADNMNNIESGIENLVNAVNAGSGGGTITVDDTLSDTSTNPVQNKVVKAAIDAKQNTLTPSVDYVVPSEITDFITKSVNDLTNYYKKTETYTQTEINQMISAIPKFSIAVVDELPTTDISDTTIYLVKTGESSQNLYTEYIYVNNAWEELGTQSVDLTGYAKETWVITQLGSYRTSAAQDEIDKKFVEKVTGKGLSTNDFTTDEKNKLAGLSNYNDSEIKAEIAEKQDIIQYAVMPEADASLANKIVQYIGNTTSTYTQGLFYKCVNALVEYRWQAISVSSDSNKLDKPATTSASAQLVTYKLGGSTETRVIDTSISSSSTDNGIPTSKAVYTELNKKVNKPTTVEEGLLGFNSTGVETIKEITVAGVSVETDTANIPNNKALKEYVAAKINNKVDKVDGKGLSTNDFTDEDKTKLDSLENYNDSEIKTSLANKVDKITGKGLSTNDYTATDKATVEYSKTLQDGFIKPLSKDKDGLIFHNSAAVTDNVLVVDDTISDSSTGIPTSSAVKSYIESYINSLDASEVAY